MSRFYNLDQAPFNSRELSKAIVAAITGQYNGAYFDAQDLSTMFQDAAGTVPVTAMEQPVGKWLDKSGNGNLATQSITASRPVISARKNLLVKTEDLSDTGSWFRIKCRVSRSGPLAPNNRLSQWVTRTDATSGSFYIEQKVEVTGNPSLTEGFYILANSTTIGKYCNLYFIRDDYAEAFAGPNILLTGDWQFIALSKQFSTAHTSVRVRLDIQSPNIGDEVAIATAQLEYGPVATSYQRVNTATDYDTAGFPKYLKFDGVDDYLNLPYMGLYANGSASIVAARDALSQATDTYTISERSTSNVNPKYLPSRQLANAGNMDAYIVNDAAAVVVDTVGSAYGGASNAVIRSVIDSGNNIKLFKNGALAANDNYTRSGTLTLTNTTIGASVSTTTSNYANMKLYGLAITKSALSDSERRRVERLLAYNSGAQI